MSETNSSHTTIPVSPDTHARIKRLKRGGETWDDLVNKAFADYDPDEN